MRESIIPFRCGHYHSNRGLLGLDAGGEHVGFGDADDKVVISTQAARLSRCALSLCMVDPDGKVVSNTDHNRSVLCDRIQR